MKVCDLPACAKGVRTVGASQPRPLAVTISGGFVYWANAGVTASAGSVWRAAL